MNRNTFLDPAKDEISCGYYIGREPQHNDFYGAKPNCPEPATVAGIYFAYWDAYQRHKMPFPRRKGIFEDSLWVFGCEKHLETYLRLVPPQFEVLTTPEIIVDAQLDLEETVYSQLVPEVTKKPVPEDYFTKKMFYNGTENLAELWQREKKQFQF